MEHTVTVRRQAGMSIATPVQVHRFKVNAQKMSDSTDSPDSTSGKHRPLLRVVILAVLLAAAWLLWSGLFKPLLLGLGGLSCALTLYILHRMGYFRNETFAFRYNPRLLGFWAWLGKEIIVSSIEVTRIILKRRIDIHPTTVTLDVTELEPLDQALLGNSITLTPGTLTLDVHEGRILVHALTQKGATDLQAGEMQRRVTALRRG